MENLKCISVFWVVSLILSIDLLYAMPERKYLKKVTKIVPSTSDYRVEKEVPVERNGKVEMIKRRVYEKSEDTVEYLKETGDYLYFCKDFDGSEVTILFEPPNKVDVLVECQVSTHTDVSGEYFLYKYSVSSATTSKQNLGNFRIDEVHSDNLIDVKYPSGWWYFPTSQWTHWIGFGSSGKYPVTAGKQVAFEIKSKLPPVILKCYAQGRPKEPHRIIAVGKEKLTKEEYRKRYPYGFEKDALGIGATNPCVTGYTIGPGQIDRSKKIPDLLQEDTKIAYEMGWIGIDEYKQLSVVINKNRTKPNLYKKLRNTLKGMEKNVASEYIKVIQTVRIIEK